LNGIQYFALSGVFIILVYFASGLNALIMIVRPVNDWRDKLFLEDTQSSLTNENKYL